MRFSRTWVTYSDPQTVWSWDGLLLNPIGFVMRRPVTTLMLAVAYSCGGLPVLEKMCMDFFRIFRSMIYVTCSSS